MIHVYAIVEASEALPSGSGLGGAAVEGYDLDGIQAIVSRHEGTRIEPTETALLEHAEVVEAAMAETGAILPARFGRGLADERDLDDLLRSRHGELTRGLEQVRGCVELGVRILAPGPAVSASDNGAATGTEYMQTRLAELARAEEVAHEIHDLLAEGARESARPDVGSGEFLLSSAYLVPRGDVDRFRGHVRSVENSYPQLVVVCTGPWPPYSFAAIAASDHERA